jgi:hypothetical protein
MATVELSEMPEGGTDLEHYVAALFQVGRYYVEKNLIERVPTDVLELDVVASDFAGVQPNPVLIEVKGGSWGWGDLFKMLGWKTYLGIPRAVLFVKSSAGKPIENMSVKMAPHGISVVSFDETPDPLDLLAAAGLGASSSGPNVWLWRHSYSIERKLTAVVAEACRAHPDRQGPQAALKYQRLVNDGTFFAKNPFERLSMLYDAYKEHPKLTLACAVELGGGPYDPLAEAAPNAVLKEALVEGKHQLIQACMFIEHRARLALLRAAIDYACEFPTVPPVGQGNIAWHQLVVDSLPQSFKSGLEWLQKQPSFRRYAVFWQQFLWGWGGFYLDHRREEEFAWMGTYSGIPTEEVPVALSAFDQLFPAPSGWLTTAGWTDVRITRMVPTYFQGLGAHHRRQEYELQDGFGSIGGAQYTASDLSRWNNTAVAFLTDSIVEGSA